MVDAYLDGAVALLDDGPRQVAGRVHGDARGGRRDRAGGVRARRASHRSTRCVSRSEPDPDFPTVAFPNPEEPGALDLALALARSSGADLVLANDPDADRLGVADPDRRRRWRALTGDEIGVLLADHLLRTGRPRTQRRGRHHRGVVSPPVELAREAGVAYGEALTGFKWVVRTAGPGQRFAVRLRGGARLLRRRARPRQGRHHRRPGRRGAGRRSSAPTGRRCGSASTSSPERTARTSPASAPSG